MDRTLSDIAWFLVVGIAVAGFLVGAFWMGRRILDRETGPPAPESQPHLPPEGASYEVSEEREYVDFPELGLQPHQMQGYGNFGSRTAEHQEEVRAGREDGYLGNAWQRVRGGPGVGGGAVPPVIPPVKHA
ncbi:DUF6479 family protein [Streptomyces sp. BI20]|uniref:DUF6479 family protein n=1 Tax=Streptomyces sp. BI20 TaxID=3403460 RepID=UPI003C756181